MNLTREHVKHFAAVMIVLFSVLVTVGVADYRSSLAVGDGETQDIGTQVSENNCTDQPSASDDDDSATETDCSSAGDTVATTGAS